MPTIRDGVLEYLPAHPEGADDIELTAVLRQRNSAQASQRCHQLGALGLAVRRRVGGGLHTFVTGQAPARPPAAAAPPAGEQPRCWEGKGQAKVVTHVRAQGYTLLRRLTRPATRLARTWSC